MLAESKQAISLEAYEAFLGLPENEGHVFELIDGEIIEKVTNEEHAVICALVVGELYIYLKINACGRLKVEARYRADDDEQNDRIPDISFTHNDRIQPLTRGGAVLQMPDLAVEIKSPRDTYTRMREKAAYYLAHGVQMVWLIFPEKRVVEVHRADADILLLTLADDDQIEGGALLPGFTLPLRAIFPT